MFCIKCLSADALVKMHMDGSGEFECAGCDETFSIEDIQNVIDAAQKWAKIIPQCISLNEAIKAE